jgi:hypothetical protein
MERRNPGVAAKVALYRRLVPHIWLADRRYIESHSELLKEVRDSLLRNNARLQRRIAGKMKPEGQVYLEVESPCELRPKLDALIDLWRASTAEEQIVNDECEYRARENRKPACTSPELLSRRI